MTAEEQAAQAERYESDGAYLRSLGQALEAEAGRRRAVNEPPLTNEAAAAFIAALPQ
jgi:hypothetical protein